MGRILHILFLTAAGMFAMAACDDVFEKDISKKQVTVVAPVDGVTVPEGGVTFLWRQTQGADAYKVTVVSPSFAQAAMVAADTLLRNDSISMKLSLHLTLAAGEYQWSIRALNSAYATAEQFYTLLVAAPEPEEPEEPEVPEEPEP